MSRTSHPPGFLAADDPARWADPKFTVDHLLGAEYALRIVRTSPRIRGGALEIVDALLAGIDTAIRGREGS